MKKGGRLSAEHRRKIGEGVHRQSMRGSQPVGNEHELDNCRRTLEKAQEALTACHRYFSHQAEMNAVAHMSERVMYPPIHSVIASTLHGITMFNECYPGEVEVAAGGPGS
jgi:hypothetical protein